MDTKMQFTSILAQYCEFTADEITADMRFREDLGMSSLDFATLLGEVEDELGIDLELDGDSTVMNVATVSEAIKLLEAFTKA